MTEPSKAPAHAQAAPFPTTSWSLIQRVQKGTEEDALRAMEDICRLYWYPIYAYARRHGFSQHDAEDLTQFFFQQLIARETIQAARQEKGRLRAFMLMLLKQVISRQIRHATAEKRGGGAAPLSFEELNAEERYAHEPRDIVDPAFLFDRAWAESVLERAESLLRSEYAEANNLPTFEAIRLYLSSSSDEAPYASIAAKLDIREGAVRIQVHRMRKRFADRVNAEIAQTVDESANLHEERDYLASLLRHR